MSQSTENGTTVRVFHNVARDEDGRPLGMLDGYEPTHPLTLVAELNFPFGISDMAICEDAFRLFNIGDDPEFGEPDPRAVEYRARKNRSLSVGDVVSIGEVSYACASFGWTRLETPLVMEPVTLHGTTPLAA